MITFVAANRLLLLLLLLCLFAGVGEEPTCSCCQVNCWQDRMSGRPVTGGMLQQM
jgi:hypothetical protein